jgi:hypothetical protein
MTLGSCIDCGTVGWLGASGRGVGGWVGIGVAAASLAAADGVADADADAAGVGGAVFPLAARPVPGDAKAATQSVAHASAP